MRARPLVISFLACLAFFSSQARAQSAAPSPAQPLAESPTSAESSTPAVVVAPAVAAPSASASSASAPSDAAPAEPPKPVSTPWKVSGAVRVNYITSHGLNPFAATDFVAQATFDGSRELVRRGEFSLAPGLRLDVGGSSAKARGVDASLSFTRVSLAAEGRYHPLSFAYAFARVGPSLARVGATARDASAPGDLVKRRWLVGGEASVGATAYVSGPNRPRFGFDAEVGYAWLPAMELDLKPELGDDDPQKVGAANLGSLALRGIFLRIGASLAF